MSREKQIDYKEYARQMRQNCARDYNGTEPIVICSSELWEEIATIIEDFDNQSEDTIEVIRCKDCKYLEEKHYEEIGYIPYIKLTCKWSNYSHQPNDYCSLAERR